MRRSEQTFRLNNGRLCFVFAATLGKRGSSAPLERLRSPSDLGRWCVEMRFTPDSPVIDEEMLTGAIALREAIVRASFAVLEGRRIDLADMATLNAWSSQSPLGRRLAQGAGQELRSTWVMPPENGLHSILAEIAADCVDLLSGELAAKIRACANPECCGLFVDVSRPGTRRWCSMGTCGNKAKKLNMTLREQN